MASARDIGLQKITDHLKSGGIVQLSTYARSIIYHPKHVDLFSQGKSGSLYVKQGKSKVCIDYSAVTFWREK